MEQRLEEEQFARKKEEKMGETGQTKPVSSFPALYLAPLAGFSDLPFRKLCGRFSVDGATTEMVSAQALAYENRRTQSLLDKDPEEGDLVLQLFGHQPHLFSEGIKKYVNADPRFQAVELNMGCPAPKIVKNGDGSALMQDPALAKEVLSAMVQASSKPVYLKMRTGWDQAHQNYLELAKMAEDVGVQRICLHGRTREAFYSGQADWEAIARLKEAVSIPVVANGDVRSPEDALRLWQETKADAISIGRGAMGRPMLFGQIKDFFLTGSYQEAQKREVLDALLLHYHWEIAYRGEERAVLEMRKVAANYLAGWMGNKEVKAKLMRATVFSQVEDLLLAFQKK